jgi:hemin uptake protein HemP
MEPEMTDTVNATAVTAVDAHAVQYQPLQLSSRELFRNGNTVRIEHEGQHYWLRLTRANKLILTK